jgi:minor extracellular serine protease Vpr
MPPRPRALRTPLLAGIALAATALVLAGTVQGAGDTLQRAAARAWHSVFGDRARPTGTEHRVLVVLTAPSLADHVAAGEATTPDQQRRWRGEAAGAQRILLAGLRERGLVVRREYVFTRTFNGFSAVVGPRVLAELERAAGVAGIYPVRTAYPATSAAAARARPDPSGAVAAAGLPGFDGRGVTIALLDSGVDRLHPLLRGHVLPGFDLIDGDRDVTPEVKPDEPAVLEAHGTRIAGVLRDVAPGARVLPIRVLGWTEAAGGGYALLGRGDALLAGLERAVDPDRDGDVEDAADVVLASVFEPYAAFADSPETRAVAGATALGTLVVAPAGNDGRPGRGFGSIGAPGAAPDALTVGALDERQGVPEAALELRAGGDVLLNEPVRVLSATGPQRRLELRAGALLGPTLADAARRPGEVAGGAELGDFFDGKGVSLVAGRAVLVPADGTSLARKAGNAAAAGAAALLVYGTELPAGALDADGSAPLPVVALPPGLAPEVLELVRAGETVGVSLGAVRRIDNPARYEVAAFSSGGLAFDGRVKPDVVAPGVGVATVDVGSGVDGGARYATATGTSAAAAFAAGAAALVVQARPELSAAELRSALVGSAAQLLRGSSPLAVTSQGAGRVDPARAAAAELAVEPATLAFGRSEGASWSASRTVSVKNVSSRTLEVGFSLAPDDLGEPTVAFLAEPARVALAPGASAEVRIGVSARDGLSPLAAGSLVVAADGARPVRVPWAVARRAAAGGPLVGEVELSHTEFTPSRTAPAVLAFRAGRIDQTPDGELVEPVGVLEVELWTAEGKWLGVLTRLRDVLPGRYAFGLTGRGPAGRVLPEGVYVVRLSAYPVDGEDGARPSTAETAFRITR